MENRRHNIDLLESLAIYLVLVYHSTLYAVNFVSDPTPLRYGAYFSRTALAVCVPLFFFVNGYLLFNRPFSLRRHVLRTLRLAVLVFFWGLALTLLTLPLKGEPFSLGTVLRAVLEQDPAWEMNRFWFLGALVCVYLFFPALKALYDASPRAFALSAGVFWLLTLGWTFLGQLGDMLGALLGRSLRVTDYEALAMFNPFRGTHGYALAYFCAGGLAFRWEPRLLALRARRRNLAAALGFLLCCCGLFLVGVFYTTRRAQASVWDPVWQGYDSIFTFFAVLFLYVLSLNCRRERPLLRCLSENTLGVYLLHGLLVRLTRPWLMAVPALRNLPVNLVYALLILLLTLGLTLLLKKLPLLRRLL